MRSPLWFVLHLKKKYITDGCNSNRICCHMCICIGTVNLSFVYRFLEILYDIYGILPNLYAYFPNFGARPLNEWRIMWLKKQSHASNRTTITEYCNDNMLICWMFIFNVCTSCLFLYCHVRSRYLHKVKMLMTSEVA